MAVAINVTPAVPVSRQSAMNIEVTGNADDGTRCYLLMDHPEGDDYKSQEFAGDFLWMTVVPDQADSLTIRLRKASDDSDIATTTVVVV